MFQQFFPQGIAVDSQHFGCMGLVVLGMGHDGHQDRFFNRTHNHVIDIGWFLAVEIIEVFLQALQDTS